MPTRRTAGPQGLPGVSAAWHYDGHLGHLPLARTKPAADAYRAVLDRLPQDFRYDVQELAEKLEFEHEEWEYATKKIDWYTQDTLFFSLT
ncbi:hypothetical protein AB0L50_30255 [Streptomyces flaveolus]|uniref:DUF7691 family protein n=1 Tax=Streptomyces flaveolus TaxID=67297 RepID=UPI00342A3838